MFGLDALPPLPEGAIGWNVYTGGGTFIEFVADEEAVSDLAAEFADEVAAYVAPE
jgi:hypothetical protein